MTNKVKNSLLHHLNFLQSIGYNYHNNLDLLTNDVNDMKLPDNLNALKEKVNNCYLCELSKSRKNTVFEEGNGSSGLMFIGEAPGVTEDETGRPFVGRAGDVLTKMIQNVIKIKREDVYITNIVKCKPSNNRLPTSSEINLCKSYLVKQIELVKPKVIVALGETAYSYLMDEKAPISKVRGQSLNYKNIVVIPTYHPSFLLRNPSSKKEAYIDMLKIKNIMESIN